MDKWFKHFGAAALGLLASYGPIIAAGGYGKVSVYAAMLIHLLGIGISLGIVHLPPTPVPDEKAP